MMDSIVPNHDSQSPADGFRFSLRQLLVWVLCINFALALCVMLAKSLQTGRREAISAASQSPLNQLLVALWAYHEHHGHFPPAYIADEDGVPMHSWRVLILPYADGQALYNAYDFTEPWDGPNNIKLANQMPSIFCSASEDPSTSYTNIVAVSGPGTAFPGRDTVTSADFADGLENTILLTEITESNVLWLQPQDVDVRDCAFRINEPMSFGFSSAHWRLPYVVFADGITAYAVQDDIPPEALQALTTIAGGEPVTRSKLIEQGYLD